MEGIRGDSHTLSFKLAPFTAKLVNQVCAGHRLACAWLFKSDPMQIVGMHVHVCACVCVHSQGF